VKQLAGYFNKSIFLTERGGIYSKIMSIMVFPVIKEQFLKEKVVLLLHFFAKIIYSCFCFGRLMITINTNSAV